MDRALNIPHPQGVDAPKDSPAEEGRPAWALGPARALTRVCEHARIDADEPRLTAGLPLVNGDLPARTLPIAAARVGLGAELQALSPGRLDDALLPCLLLLKSGHVALATARQGKTVTLYSDDGDHAVSVSQLSKAATGEGLVFHIKAESIVGAQVDETQAPASPFRALLARFVRRKSVWVQLVVAGVIINLTALVLPLFLMSVYDRVVPNLAMETLWALGIGVLIAIGFEFSLKIIRQNLIETVALRISTELQHLAADRLLRANMADAPRLGGAAMSGLKETDAVTNIIPSAALALFVDLPFFLIVLALIYSIGGAVALAPLAGAVALFCIGAWANMGMIGASKDGVKFQDARQNLLHDMLEGLGHIKASMAEGQFLRHWNVIGDQAAMASKRARFWAMFPVHGSSVIMQLVTIGVIVIGVLQLQAGNLTVGGMVACTLLSNRAMAPISTLNGLVSRALQSLAAFRSVFKILELPQERSYSAAGVSGSRLRGEVRAVDATFAYRGSEKPALEGMSFHMPPGSKIALIGKSGSGKTSLLSVLAGLYPVTSGDVFIDGFNLKQYGANDLRRHIGYAPQSARLFNLSLKDNIILGLQTVQSEDLVRALNISGLGQFVANHEEGLAMNIGPNGERLSGGQRQALLLARALVGNPSLLLLDEPTSAMDSASEQRVVQGLSQMMTGRTTLISTHRTPLLRLVDRIIWMEGGRIQMDGPRDEVIAAINAQKTIAKTSA
jgi:ATP-binding cassette subfamily C protein LapB